MKFSIIIILLFSNTLLAQVEWGITTGLNASSQLVSYDRSTRFGDYGGPYDLKIGYVMGYQAGITISARFNNRLSLKTDVLYSGKGQTETSRSRTTGDIKDFTDHINYIVFPVSLSIDLGGDKDKGLFVLGGAYVARTITANSWVHYYYSNIDITNTTPAEIDDNIEIWNSNFLYLKTFDVGMRAGVGYRSGIYTFQIINELGLTNNISHISEYFVSNGPVAAFSNQSTRKNFSWSATVTCFPFTRVNPSLTGGKSNILFGVKTGVNASNVSSGNGAPALGIGGGVFTLINFAKRWGLRMELVHSSFGTRTKETGEFKINRVSIPALVNFSLNKINVEVGPELNYLLRVGTKPSATIEIDDKFKEWDYGLTFGIEYTPLDIVGVSLRSYFGLRQHDVVYIHKKAAPEVIKSGQYNILSLSINYYFKKNRQSDD